MATNVVTSTRWQRSCAGSFGFIVVQWEEVEMRHSSRFMSMIGSLSVQLLPPALKHKGFIQRETVLTRQNVIFYSYRITCQYDEKNILNWLNVVQLF